MFFPANSQQQPNFSQNVLILGIASVGNVGQLAVDALITTFKAQRVGYIHGEYILPLVGNDPYYVTKKLNGVLHTAAEVYQIPSKKITLVQIRTPIAKGYNTKFAQDFVQWALQNSFSRVLVLSSANASWRQDQMIRETPIVIRCASSISYKESASNATDNNNNNNNNEGALPFKALNEEERKRFLQGTAKNIIEEADNKKAPIQFASIIVLCNEGNNIPHAMVLADAAVVAAFGGDQTAPVEWKTPVSWTHLYGPPFDPSLF